MTLIFLVGLNESIPQDLQKSLIRAIRTNKSGLLQTGTDVQNKVKMVLSC